MKRYDLVIFIVNLLSLVGLFEISVASLGCVHIIIIFKMLLLAKQIGAVLLLVQLLSVTTRSIPVVN